MTKQRAPSYLNFNNEEYPWKPGIDYKQHPLAYRVGKGEQGVLICEPYKAEIGKYWRFKTAEIAEESSKAIAGLFDEYLKNKDFVGADMARKYLQMGFTRARRYANYKGGRKYDKDHDYAALERGTGEDEKARAAAVFFDKWKQAEADPDYAEQKKNWKELKG